MTLNFPLVASASTSKVVFTTDDGRTTVIPDGHPQFAALTMVVRVIEAARRAGDDVILSAAPGLLAQIAGVAPIVPGPSFARVGSAEARDNTVRYEGEPLGGLLADRIRWSLKEGLDSDRLLAFLGRLMENPSARIVTELYGFVEQAGMALTDDGCLIAYVAASPDLTPGSAIAVRRNRVQEDPLLPCEVGLRFGAYPANLPAGEKIVAVKIDPSDVVSIPAMISGQGRACRFEVLRDCIPPKVFGGAPANRSVASEPASRPAPQPTPTPQPVPTPLVDQRDRETAAPSASPLRGDSFFFGRPAGQGVSVRFSPDGKPLDT